MKDLHITSTLHVEMDQIHHENSLIAIETKNAEQLQGKVKTFLTHISHRKILRSMKVWISIGFAIYYWLNLRTMRQEKLVFEQKYIRGPSYSTIPQL